MEDYIGRFGFGEKTGIELTGEAYGVVAGPTYKKELYRKQLNYYLKYKLNIEDEKLRETICSYVNKDMEYSKIRTELQELGLDRSVASNIISNYIAKSKWMLYDSVQTAIGQNYNTATPIQVVSYISTLVNGGTRYKPYLVEKIVGYDGSVKLDKKPEVVKQLEINPADLEALLQGMQAVNLQGGTAYSEFRDLKTTSGGKTGTAQAFNAQPHAWYVAFAPYEKPEIAVVAVVMQGGHGNYTAPIARAIIEQYLTAEEVRDNITPTNDIIR